MSSELGSRAARARRGGTGGPTVLLDSADAHEAFGEFGVLPEEFTLERVTLLTAHRRNVERIVQSGDISTVSFGRPWTREIHASAARYARFRVIRPDPREVGKRRPRPHVPRACEPACRGASRAAPAPSPVSPRRFAGPLWLNRAVSGQSEPNKAQPLSAPGRHRVVASPIPSGAAACLHGVWRYLCPRCGARCRSARGAEATGVGSRNVSPRGCRSRSLPACLAVSSRERLRGDEGCRLRYCRQPARSDGRG